MQKRRKSLRKLSVIFFFFVLQKILIHYPNQDVREKTLVKYGKLGTPDARNGMNLYEQIDVPDACIFCQHVNYCRNALYAGDQENYYD